MDVTMSAKKTFQSGGPRTVPWKTSSSKENCADFFALYADFPKSAIKK